MRSEELLEHTLNETGLPVKAYEYRGKEPEYIVYNEEDERGAAYRDDAPEGVSIWWQVHLFAPMQSEYRKRKREIRKRLMKAGFGVGYIKTLYEKETKTAHVVLTCHMIEDMED